VVGTDSGPLPLADFVEPAGSSTRVRFSSVTCMTRSGLQECRNVSSNITVSDGSRSVQGVCDTFVLMLEFVLPLVQGLHRSCEQ
jgi:hypothetical protein